jgi:peptidyl-prolyl cis-trans isomerase B (cyclophilin B)
LLSACSTTGVSEEQASSPAPSESASVSTPAPSESAAPAASASGGPCKPSAAVGSQPKDVGAPNDVLPAKSYSFNLKTNCGDIEITADAVKAPITVSTLAFLAKGGFYNGTICHRLTTQGLYVLQCGDPTATGGGGPNFTFKDENLPAQADNNYPAGSVAMANSGPNTNGSQFFLVYADTTLGANYTLWGKITKGLDIVKSIAEYGTADGSGDGAPKATVEIINASVK